MQTRAKQAGPEPHRAHAFPVGSEAAGPAVPRLIIHAVELTVGRDNCEARTTLGLNSHRFIGSAVGRAQFDEPWQLAAAASVDSMQQYLQQSATGPPTPQVKLLDVAALTTGIGQDVISAVVRISHGNRQLDLIGSALVRNDRSHTAVAAALDAVSRPLASYLVSTKRDSEDGFQPTILEIGPTSSEARARAPETECPPQVRFPALGVVITAAAIRTAAVDRDGRVLAEARRASRARVEPEVTLGLALQSVREALAALNSSGPRPGAIGVAVPGSLHSQDGVCISCGDFPAWRDIQITAPFADEFGLPTALLSPTQAAAFAETCFGAAQGLADVLYVRVGIDIDVALVLDGRLLPLPRMLPGQPGHMVIEAGGPRCACGQSGCWQALAGREALLARVVKAVRRGAPSAVAAAAGGNFGAITPGYVVRMAASGDAVARGALEETGRYLAIGLANLATLFSPQAIIVDSSPASLGKALLHAAEGTLKSTARARVLSQCVLLSPELGDSATLLGTAAWAARCAP